jgi:ureidoglycolate lyase
MLKPEPLTKAAFSPFGDVVEMNGHTPLHINQGFALRFDNLAFIDVASHGGQSKVSLFTAKPRPKPIVIDLMERHPLGSQLFYPLQERTWLIVVCDDPYDVITYRTFAATGRQGINYHRNIWHFPLLVFEAESRFIVVDRTGPGNNLEEVRLETPFSIAFDDGLFTTATLPA